MLRSHASTSFWAKEACEDMLAGSCRCSDSSADELVLPVLHSSSSDEQLASKKERHGVPACHRNARVASCSKLSGLCELAV